MKRVAIILSALLLCVTFAMPSSSFAASGFPDVKQYKDEINYLTEKDIIRGFDDGTFGPTIPIKRKQAVEMILREMGITDLNAPDPEFTDLHPGDEAYPAIAKAVELGIISGKIDADTGISYFDPYGNLTRGQMAKIMVLAYKLEGEYHKTFKDVPKKNEAYEYISTLAANNITTGYKDSTFNPYGTLTREHFAVFMARLLDERFKKEPNLPIEDFEHLSLGMSKSAVKKAEKDEPYAENDSMLMYRDKNVLGFPADVLYEFEEDELTAINIFHDMIDDDAELDTLEGYFIVFHDKLEDVYGKADYLDDDWEDDSDGYSLAAMWLGYNHDVLLTVQIKTTDSTLGGIRITRE